MSQAIAYLRYSSDPQGAGDSIRRQRDLAEAVAGRRGLTIVEWVEDHGLSAYSGEHVETGNLGKLLERARRNELEEGTYLLFENFDRLTRLDVFSSTEVLLTFYRAGILLLSTSDDTVHDGQQGLLALLRPMFETERAHSESRTKAGRVREAWASKRAAALNGPHKLTARIPAWLRAVRDQNNMLVGFEPIPDRTKLILEIFEWSANGLGKFSIATQLNATGVMPWAGSKGWRPSYIQKILNNRAVLGEYQPHQRTATKYDTKVGKRIGGKRVMVGDPITNYYPQIISFALWERTRTARAMRRGKGGRRGAGLSNLFSGLCRCWYCGSKMTFRNPGNGGKAGKPYLICDRALRKAGCFELAKYPYHDVEGPVLHHLDELLFDPAEITSFNNGIAKAENQIAALANHRITKQTEITRLIDAIAAGDNPYVADAISNRTNEIEQIKRQEVAAKAHLEELRGRITSSERRAAIGALQSALSSNDEAVRFAARSHLSQELRGIITEMVFDGGSFYLSVGDGIRTYQFGKGMLQLLDQWNEENPKTKMQKRFAERIARIRRTESNEEVLEALRRASEMATRDGDRIFLRIPEALAPAILEFVRSARTDKAK